MPAMRGDPIGAISDSRRAFEIGFRLLLIPIEKRGQVETLNGRSRLIPGIDANNAVFVAGHGKQMFRQRHGGRGVTHSCVNHRRGDAGCGMGIAGDLCYLQKTCS